MPQERPGCYSPSAPSAAARPRPAGDAPYRVLSLFAGIGGFDLGLERAGGFKTIALCEIDPFCQQVLRKHWPDARHRGDVLMCIFERGEADVIVGGFPCQDISLAGRGAGITGSRSGLWRELLRAIRLVRPRYAIVENVAALLGRGMGDVLGDLAAVGYDAEWHCVPTGYAFGHERERVFIIAHPDSEGLARSGQSGEAVEQARQAVARELAATCFCRPGPPPELVRNVRGIPNRMDRIRALGNAVVPQAVEAIGRGLLAQAGETGGGDAPSRLRAQHEHAVAEGHAPLPNPRP